MNGKCFKKRAFLFGFFVLLIFSITMALIAVEAKAGESVDEVDTYFENVRAELLAFYNSELVSHSAIILGLTVGLLSASPHIWRALNSQKKRASGLGLFALLLVFALLVYCGARFVYWSDLGAALGWATKDDVSKTTGYAISASNVTSSMVAINKFAVTQFEKDNRIAAIAAKTIRGLLGEPPTWLGIVEILALFVLPIVYAFRVILKRELGRTSANFERWFSRPKSKDG